MSHELSDPSDEKNVDKEAGGSVGQAAAEKHESSEPTTTVETPGGTTVTENPSE